MGKLFYHLLAASMLIVLFSCTKDEDILNDDIEVPAEVIATNSWILETLKFYYLWNDQIPTNIDIRKEPDPEAYFEKLLNEEDKWSWIGNDYASFTAELSGEPVSMGYDPQFRLYGGGTEVLIAVNFVYPDSPAEEAGLERGDLILKIDDIWLNIDNYYDLYSGTEYSVQLAELNGLELTLTGESIDLTASVVITNPIIYFDIFEIDDDKIGYLVYSQFISGDGDEFLTALYDVFEEFNTAGITDLIVDLRYNRGGETTAAQHLASSIAPAADVAAESVIINMEYNDDLEEYFEYYGWTDMFSLNFTTDAFNLDLDRVYFLTAWQTASASELVITGLEPYMDVIQIGEYTYGKYVGGWYLPDDYDEWFMYVIGLKYANIDGYTDFVNGLVPDVEIEDNIGAMLPFGNTSDPMVSEAIYQITGITLKSAPLPTRTYPEFRKIIPKEIELKSSLFFPLESMPVE